MNKPLRHYSRRDLKEALERVSLNVQFSYDAYESELRRRESRLMTTAVVCNAVFILTDIVIRILR